MPRPRSSSQAAPATATKRQPRTFSYLGVYRALPRERIDMIQHGFPATEAKRIFADLAIGQGAALRALKLSPATVNKKAKQDRTLSPAESERVIGIARLVGQLEAMVQESGASEGFDAAAWMSRWLKEPLPALGGARPIDLVDTMEGQALVSTALAQMQSGAYT
jgi:putative toxin-antitoxin system antitoxin component (TIGR02293 family)